MGTPATADPEWPDSRSVALHPLRLVGQRTIPRLLGASNHATPAAAPCDRRQRTVWHDRLPQPFLDPELARGAASSAFPHGAQGSWHCFRNRRQPSAIAGGGRQAGRNPFGQGRRQPCLLVGSGKLSADPTLVTRPRQPISQHTAGSGAAIMRYVQGRGIGFEVAATWHGGRDLERRLKRRHNAPQALPHLP
jgi:hypothetical protein